MDIETDTRWPGVGPKREYGLSYPADILIIALAWREGNAITTTALSAPFSDQVRDFLVALFSSDHMVIAHNAVFDIRQLSKLTGGQVPEHVWDTMAMARLLHPSAEAGYGLLDVASALAIPFSKEQQAMKGERNRLHALAFDTTLAYAQADARLALQIYEKQQALADLSPELVDWECRAIREYCRMAARGVKLNVEYVEQRLRELSKERNDAALRLQRDGLSNPGSSQARAIYLYRTKQIPMPTWDPDSHYFTRAGRRRLSKLAQPVVTLDDLSTSSDVIESYVEEESPYADRLKDLADYLSADWLISTLTTLMEHAALDGRIHSIVTIGTDTGRRASSHPQVQNWKMPAMAGVATGDAGFTLVELDLSNAENVMAAFIAGDSALSAACNTDDFHSAMAVQYFGEAWTSAGADERKHLRNLSKRITYGTNYGMGATSLAKSLDVSVEEAQRLLRVKDRAFPAMTRAKAASKRQATETGRVMAWTGRPIALRSAFVSWNYRAQGGIAELIKRAIVLISEMYRAEGMKSWIALDIHDALVLEVAHEEWDKAIQIATETIAHITPDEMNNRTTPPIRWVARPKIEANRAKWGFGQWHP